MPGSFRPTLWHVTVATLALGACGDDTLGPAKPADPMATAASIQALDASFSSPTFQSFTYAATYSPAAAGALAPLRTDVERPSELPGHVNQNCRFEAAN